MIKPTILQGAVNVVIGLAALCLTAGCNGCHSEAKPLEEKSYQVVSNTHGEIEKIIIRNYSSGVYDSVYYHGLIKTIDPKKVIGIVYTLPANQDVIKALYLESPETNPETFGAMLKLHMDSVSYKQLDTIYGQLFNFKELSNTLESPSMIIPDIYKIQFEADVATRVIAAKKTKFDKLVSNKAPAPHIIVTLDYEGSSFDLLQDDGTYRTKTGWLQDALHAFQQFDHNKQIQLKYASTKKFETHKNTVAELKKQLKYIDTAEVHYLYFDGGNFIPSENYVLVGENFYEQNKINYPLIKEELKTFFNVKHIIITGMGYDQLMPHRQGCDLFTESQPLFHLDMFLTPAGKRKGKNLIFMGQVYKSLYHPDSLDQQRIDIIDQLNSLIQLTAKNIQSNYNPHDTSPDKLADFVFDTIPLFIKFGKEKGENGDYYCATSYVCFNNCIIEIIKPDSKIVYLPDYRDSSLFSLNKARRMVDQKFKDAGFCKRYFMQPPLDTLRDGALHCYTKVLWRKKYTE